MTSRVWVIGPIAWDSVYYLDQLPQAGEFAQTYKNIERPGGTAANSAIAIASAGIETGFVGYVGDDSLSEKLLATLKNSEIKNLHLEHLTGAPSHVAIFIDKEGERTIVGLSEDRLDVVSLSDVDLQSGDIVVFQLWRDHFTKDLALAKAAGCITVVGIEALATDISADIVIGSESDSLNISELPKYLERFDRIVITRGADGASEFSQLGEVKIDALKVVAVDATGAGDSFLAGYVTALAQGKESGEGRLTLGTTWAALAVQIESSIPPHFSKVQELLNR
jgi:sugar/nucleoside kinase (ribokinase family)